MVIVEFLPTIFVGLLLGPLLDRLERRSLMVAADAVRVGVFVALPFAPNAATVVGLAAIAGLATGFFRPAVYAGVPNLVPDGELPRANALHNVEARLCRSVLEALERSRDGRLLPATQETLAEMVGTTRSRVNFFMKTFQRLGFIEYTNGLKVNNSLLAVVLHN